MRSFLGMLFPFSGSEMEERGGSATSNAQQIDFLIHARID